MEKFERLAKLADAQAMLMNDEKAVSEAAISARLGGATWEEIGYVLSITKQAAFKRYSDMLPYDYPAPE